MKKILNIISSPLGIIILVTAVFVVGVVLAQVAIGPGDKFSQEITTKVEGITRLANHEQIKIALNQINEQRVDFDEETASILDARWIKSSEQDLFVQEFFTNSIGLDLGLFAEEHPECAEIFITDKKGFIAGTTNKTSDFYQADEQWWIDAANGEYPYVYQGGIEYDTSANSWVVPVFVSVYDENQELLGVLKAVIGLNNIEYGT